MSTCGLGIFISPPTNLASNLSPDVFSIVNLSTSGDALRARLLPLLTKALLPPPPNNLNRKLFFNFLTNFAGSSSFSTFGVFPISDSIGVPVAPPVFVIDAVGNVVVM